MAKVKFFKGTTAPAAEYSDNDKKSAFFLNESKGRLYVTDSSGVTHSVGEDVDKLNVSDSISMTGTTIRDGFISTTGTLKITSQEETVFDGTVNVKSLKLGTRLSVNRIQDNIGAIYTDDFSREYNNRGDSAITVSSGEVCISNGGVMRIAYRTSGYGHYLAGSMQGAAASAEADFIVFRSSLHKDYKDEDALSIYRIPLTVMIQDDSGIRITTTDAILPMYPDMIYSEVPNYRSFSTPFIIDNKIMVLQFTYNPSESAKYPNSGADVYTVKLLVTNRVNVEDNTAVILYG